MGTVFTFYLICFPLLGINCSVGVCFAVFVSFFNYHIYCVLYCCSLVYFCFIYLFVYFTLDVFFFLFCYQFLFYIQVFCYASASQSFLSVVSPCNILFMSGWECTYFFLTVFVLQDSYTIVSELFCSLSIKIFQFSVILLS